MTYNSSTHLRPTVFFRTVHTLLQHVLTGEATGWEPGTNPATRSQAPKPGCPRALVHGVQHCELRHRPASHESSVPWARRPGDRFLCRRPGRCGAGRGCAVPSPAPPPAPQSFGSSTITINVLIKMHYLPKI